MRDLDQDAGAVARLDLGPGRTAVRQALEDGQAAVDDVVVGPAVQIGHHADATGVVFVCRVVEASGHRRPSDVGEAARLPGRRWPEGGGNRIHDGPRRLGTMPSCVHIVGGGVIGLACAWELSRNGHAVTVVAPAPGRDGASWVAAGMLAPVTEAQFGESALTALLLEGARLWPGFAAALENAAGQTIGYDTTGTVTVALDASDRASLDDLLTYQHTLGLAHSAGARASAVRSSPHSVPPCGAASRSRATTRWTTAHCSPRSARPAATPAWRSWRARCPPSPPGPSSFWRTAAASAPTTSCWRPGPVCPPSPASRRPGSPKCAP